MNIRAMLLIGLAFAVAACGADEPETQADSAAETAEAEPATADETTEPADTATVDQPPPPAPETMSVSESDAAAEAPAYDRLYTVQIAAFVDPDTAQSLARAMERRNLSVFITQAEVEGRTFNRVRIGASPNLSEARELGRWITRQFEWPVWVAPVEDMAVVPAGAVESTRSFLRRS